MIPSLLPAHRTCTAGIDISKLGLMNERKHILLIEPDSRIDRGLIPPYSLMALARMFADTEFDVTIIDCHLDKDYWQSITAKLDDTVMVGITSLSGLQPAVGADLCRRIKALTPH